MIVFIPDLEEFVDENEAATIAARFSQESVERALELAREGYEMHLEIGGEDQLDHHYIDMRLFNDDGEIEQQRVIQTHLTD